MFPPQLQWHNVSNISCSYLNGTMGPSKTRLALHSRDVCLSALLHQILPVGHQRGLGVVADVNNDNNNKSNNNSINYVCSAHICIDSLELAFRLELLVGQKT